jgi:predicted MFS family arabinose efflux permease
MGLLRRPAPDSLWRNRDFNLLWGGQALSSLGSAMADLAFPLLVLALTGSPVAAGWVGTIALAVQVVVSLPSGVLVDRVNRRRLMMACDVVRMVAFGVLAVALVTGQAGVALVLVVAVVDALCETPFFNAAMAAVRNLVLPAQVSPAVARNEARQYAVTLAGPPLGGAAFGLGHAVPFAANAVSFTLSLGGLLLIKRPMQEPARVEPSSPLRDLGEGLSYAVTHPFVRAAMLIAAPLNVAINGVLFGVVLILQENGTAPALIGTAATIFGFGGLVGALFASTLMQRFTVTTLIRGICVAGVPLFLAVLPLSSSPLATVPVALLAFLAPALNASLFGHLAKVVPDRLQGRVISALLTSAMALTALAPLAVGLLVHRYGAVGVVLGTTAAMAISAAVAVTSKGIREIDA